MDCASDGPAPPPFLPPPPPPPVVRLASLADGRGAKERGFGAEGVASRILSVFVREQKRHLRMRLAVERALWGLGVDSWFLVSLVSLIQGVEG